jgi:hypothetical protein
MDINRLMELNISSNILAAFYAAKTGYCVLNQKEPDAGEKERILKEVISMFENLSTSYLHDIEDLAEGAR